MKEFSLVCLIFCLLGCVPTLQNQSAVNPPSTDKTTKEIADTQECARPALSADKVVVTDSIVDDKPNKIVTAAMAGVWGEYFIAFCGCGLANRRFRVRRRRLFTETERQLHKAG